MAIWMAKLDHMLQAPLRALNGREEGHNLDKEYGARKMDKIRIPYLLLSCSLAHHILLSLKFTPTVSGIRNTSFFALTWPCCNLERASPTPARPPCTTSCG